MLNHGVLTETMRFTVSFAFSLDFLLPILLPTYFSYFMKDLSKQEPQLNNNPSPMAIESIS